MKRRRSLCKLLPKPLYFNLYGPDGKQRLPYYEVPAPIPEDSDNAYPIGKTCSHLQAHVVDECGADVDGGRGGELCISGRGVMQGYWNLPEQTAKGFVVDAKGTSWYWTGIS